MTDLDKLLATKYQLSLGVYLRIGRGLLSFSVTENLQNVEVIRSFRSRKAIQFAPASRHPCGVRL